VSDKQESIYGFASFLEKLISFFSNSNEASKLMHLISSIFSNASIPFLASLSSEQNKYNCLPYKNQKNYSNT